MTREEKIKGLYSLKEYLVKNPIELEGHKSLPITLIDYAIEALEQEPTLSIDDVMAVFDDFMCGEVDEEGTETFLEMLKDKAEIEPQKSEGT